MRSNAKLSAGLKRSCLREGHVPPVPGGPPSPRLMAFRRVTVQLVCIGKYFGTLRADRYKQADRLTG